MTIRIENEEIGSYTGPFYAIAEKLREYNFDVVEKDITDQWAQQAMQLQMRAPDIRLPREATDEELRKAVWVVRPGREPDPMSETPPPAVGRRLSEHLAFGGSAMVLFGVQDDPMMTVLAPWGVNAQPGTVVFHDRPPETEGRVSDQVDQWRREQALFVLNDYGAHSITAACAKPRFNARARNSRTDYRSQGLHYLQASSSHGWNASSLREKHPADS